jgi:hypothetical protein
VVDPGGGPCGHQNADLAGDVGGPGGLAALIVDDADRARRACAAEHRGDEAIPLGAVQPGRPHHIAGAGQRGEHGALAGQLGPAIGGARRGRVIFPVRLPGRAVEDVVGRHLDQGDAPVGARAGEQGDCLAIDLDRGLLLCLGLVHGRPGGAVHHDVRLVAVQGGIDRRRVGDVQLGPGQRDELLAVLSGQQRCQVLAEHPGRAGDEPAGHRTLVPPAAGRPGGAGRGRGSHQPRLAAYHSMVALRPSANGTSGAYPIDRSSESSRQ